jgi:hypothetical protein
MSGKQTRTKSHEAYQVLSNAEERTLVRYYQHLTATGYSTTPMVLREMALEIRKRRVRVASTYSTEPSSSNPIGQKWLYRFMSRHPNQKGVYSRQLESARHKEATSDKISAWFDAFHTRMQERDYTPCNVYNID